MGARISGEDPLSEEIIRKKMDLFAYFFLIAQRIQYVTDQVFQRDGLTTKQWLVSLAIEQGFEYPPSLSEVADMLSSSHQNIRQIANQLEKKGLLEYFKDSNDRRVLRLTLTDKSKEYYESKSDEHLGYVLKIFEGFSDEEIKDFHDHIMNLYKHLDPIYDEFRNS